MFKFTLVLAAFLIIEGAAGIFQIPKYCTLNYKNRGAVSQLICKDCGEQSLESDFFTVLNDASDNIIKNITINKCRLENINEVTGDELLSLDLSENNLNQLPVINLPKMVQLNLSENSLTEIFPKSLEMAKNLREIILNHNKITTLPNDLFTHQNNLEVLRMSDNSLENINADLFESTKNLKSLDLNKNNLKSLDRGVFSNLHELTLLDLSDNPSLEINSEFVRNNLKLRTINLRNTKSTVGKEIFEQLPNLLVFINADGKGVLRQDVIRSS